MTFSKSVWGTSENNLCNTILYCRFISIMKRIWSKSLCLHSYNVHNLSVMIHHFTQYALQYCQFLEEEHHTRKCVQLGSGMFSPMFFVILSFQKFCENDPWTLENWFSACALPTLVGLGVARKEFEAVDWLLCSLVKESFGQNTALTVKYQPCWRVFNFTWLEMSKQRWKWSTKSKAAFFTPSTC